MPYYFLTGGRAVEIDEDTFDDLMARENRAFELLHDNPNRSLVNLWYSIVGQLEPGDYPDEGIMVAVDMDNDGGYIER